jgi:tRNA (guanosine-2'-O-)-methyltransferase
MSGTFPHDEAIEAGGARIDYELALRLLEPMISAERRARIEEVARGRTYAFVPVLENLYDRGNASAVMRSAEALGFQRVDLIEPGERFKHANRVTQGADKWLDVYRWKSASECLPALRARGYRILATHFDASAAPVGDIDFSEPIALVFGNEKDGVSAEALALADGRAVIPMHGFVQSFNISVAAAICLYCAYRDRVARLGRQGDLGEREVRVLRALFSIRSARNPERLVERLLQRSSPAQMHSAKNGQG